MNISTPGHETRENELTLSRQADTISSESARLSAQQDLLLEDIVINPEPSSLSTLDLTSVPDTPVYQPLTLSTQALSAFLPGYSEHQLQEALEGFQQLHRYAFQQQGIHAGTFNDYIMPCFPVLQGIERLTAPESPLHSLLILGDSGTGKSLLGKHVVWEAWKNFKPGDRIPLFISLASIKKQGPHKLKNKLLKTALKNFLESDNRFIKYLQAYNRWLLIFDGYDEIGYQGNLYLENELVNYNIKLITTCRPEALPSHDYQPWFHGYKALVQNEEEAFWEVRLTPFNKQQIKDYLKCRSRYDFLTIENEAERLEKIEQRAQERWKLLETMPSVKALAENPFILSRIIPVLGQLQERHKQGQAANENSEENTYQLTRSEVYEVFVADWFQSQAQRIQLQGYFKTLSLKRLTALLHCYAENLAHTCLKVGQIEIEIAEDSTLHRELLKARYPSQQGLEKNERDALDENQLKALRSGCLLKTCAGGFNFIHKSLIEYFCAKDLFNGVMANIEGAYRSLLLNEENNENQKSKAAFHEELIRDPQTLQLLVDEIIRKPQFKLVLWHLVELSKSEAYLAKASANAMTLLNLAGESFVGKDLQGARFPGTDLRESNFSGANLAEVDATGVNFSQACLFNTQLQSAILTDVEFGETSRLGKKGKIFLGLIKKEMVSSCCFSNNNHQLAVAQETGQVLLYDTATWNYKSIQIWKMGDMWIEHCSLAYSPDDSYLLIASSPLGLTNYRLQLYHLKTNHLFQIENLTSLDNKLDNNLGKITYFKVTFSLDNKFMAIATEHESTDRHPFLRLYSLTSKKRLSQIKCNKRIQKLSFSQDGLQLFALNNDAENYSITSYAVPSLDQQLSSEVFPGISADICWHNTHLLCAVGNENSITIYQDNKLLWKQTSNTAQCVRLIHGGNKLLVAAGDRWQLWNIAQKKCIYNPHLGFEAEDLRLSADESTVAWIEHDKISAWSIQEGQYLNSHQVKRNCIELSSHGNYLATLLKTTGFIGHSLQILNIKGTNVINTKSNNFIKGYSQHSSLAYFENKKMQNTELESPDKLYLAESHDKQVNLYTLPNKETYATFDWGQAGNYPAKSKLITLAFSNPANFLALGIRSGEESENLINHCILQIWDIDNKKLHHVFHRRGLAQSLNNLHLCFISFNGNILLCSVIPFKKIILHDIKSKIKFLSIRPQNLLTGFVLDNAMATASHNGQWLVWADQANNLYLYSLSNKKLVCKIQALPGLREDNKLLCKLKHSLHSLRNADAPPFEITPDLQRLLDAPPFETQYVQRLLEGDNKLLFSQDSQFLYTSFSNNGNCLWQLRPEQSNCPLQLITYESRAYGKSPLLNLQYTNFTNALGLPERYQPLLKKQGAIGKLNFMPSENVKREREIRNSRQKIYTPTTTTLFNTGLMLDPAIGVAYLAIMKDDFHSFILLEYVENQQRYFKKLELVIDENKPLHRKLFNVTGNAQIRIKDVDEKTILERANTQGYQGFCLGNVTRRQLEQLIKLAERDQNALIKYSRNAKSTNYWSGLALNPLIKQFPSLASLKPNDNSYNCFKWCKSILAEAKIYNKELERAEDPQVTFKEKVFAFATDNPRLYLTRRLQLTIDDMAEQEKQTTKTNMTL